MTATRIGFDIARDGSRRVWEVAGRLARERQAQRLVACQVNDRRIAAGEAARQRGRLEPIIVERPVDKSGEARIAGERGVDEHRRIVTAKRRRARGHAGTEPSSRYDVLT